MALATAAVTKYAAERPPRRLMVLTVQGSKDPSHSLSESLRRERQRAKSCMARIELKRAPMKEVAKTIVLFQRGMIEEKRGERRKERERGREMKEWRQGPLAGGRSESVLHAMTNRCYRNWPTLPALARDFLPPRMITARHNSPNIARVPAVHSTPRYSRSSDNHPDRNPLRPHSRLHDLPILIGL